MIHICLHIVSWCSILISSQEKTSKEDCFRILHKGFLLKIQINLLSCKNGNKPIFNLRTQKKDVSNATEQVIIVGQVDNLTANSLPVYFVSSVPWSAMTLLLVKSFQSPHYFPYLNEIQQITLFKINWYFSDIPLFSSDNLI